jgi:hypothetical protein
MNKDFGVPLPRDKHDTENAMTLVSLGWERVKPVMPQILDWMQDMNWPVARVFQPFLVQVGAPLAPYLQTVFESDDDAWKYSILVGIVDQSPELAVALRADLERLSESPTAGEQLEGLSEQAKEILRS